ncbi:C69 family dipeptidase [Draconibacterium sp. IB214405]|uniref:dipeptidase n=1 Tax=Draconibacterium sp. IB214405 TaxID=3097352 RepID=UPI002A0D7334|nr:C69 family dipeptidase [Draconibacterium sp. IB214405]MDX8339851.1 C69 family dipeptidase [Draconibacterium sp. IB214405]
MRKIRVVGLLVIALMLFNQQVSNGCTNFLISKGASIDGSTMITYAADSHTLYGELYFQPAADHPEGAMRKIYEWDTGILLGEIPQPAHTYSVIGNMNEFQLAIAETTFGGRSELSEQNGAIMDYGSLIYVTLQRAKTAREAIEVMTGLVEEFGYYSSGESFSIADPEEVWILEMIGKGQGEKGAVWVAMRIPDGFISGHANQARITTFPLNDSKNCLYSKDVISFAREKGWYTGTNKDFSFSDVYAPVDFGAARFCDARVWAGFNKVAGGMAQYTDYAKGNVETAGENNFPSNRLPLWVKPDKQLDVQDVMDMMRDHFEGTDLDMTQDLGAGPYGLPYRWRGLTWEVDSVEYCNERAISTQQTGFSFVAQCRSWLPDPIGGILWFGVDDAYSSCYVPMYCGITEIPECFAVGNGDLLTYSETAAFWTFSQVANYAYLRYSDMIIDIKLVQRELEDKFVAFVPVVDKAAETLYNTVSDAQARKFITEFSANEAENMTKRWKELYHYLIVKYTDGNIKRESNGEFERTETGMPASPIFAGYPEWWYKAVVNATGDHFKVIGNSH